MRSFLCLFSFSMIACLACAPDEPEPFGEPVARVMEPGIRDARIVRNSTGFTGHLYITVGDREWAVYDQVIMSWLSEDRETVYWSYSHHKSGFEGEGQGLSRYSTESDLTEMVFEDDVMIDSVKEATSKSGRTVLIVKMSDGGVGARSVAVVDPDRGRVFREQFASITFSDGVVTVSTYEDAEASAELDGSDAPTPLSVQDYDLDELLERVADREILSPWPPE